MVKNNDDIIVILTRLCTDMTWVKGEIKELKDASENHLKSHAKINLLAWSTAAGAILALILALMK